MKKGPLKWLLGLLGAEEVNFSPQQEAELLSFLQSTAEPLITACERECATIDAVEGLALRGGRIVVRVRGQLNLVELDRIRSVLFKLELEKGVYDNQTVKEVDG